MYSGAKAAICRRALPDIKSTIFQMICDHLADDEQLFEGEHYKILTNTATIKFCNGSEITPLYWADKRWSRMQSRPLSCAYFEELTENDASEKNAFDFVRSRIGRVLHVPERFIVAGCNPDEPDHWVYKYFMESPHASKFVFYSQMDDNPFLLPSYKAHLRATLNPLLARRLLDGEWISLQGERIYFAYSREKNYKDEFFNYENVSGEFFLAFDFNIGHGKPMSSCIGLKDRHETYHVFKSIGIEGVSTLKAMESWSETGIISKIQSLTICGDASGFNRDTRGQFTDWDIVSKFLSENYPRLQINWKVPRSNPSVRYRQNLVNSVCESKKGHRLILYKDAQLLHEGLMGTKNKKGSSYLEDDSFYGQHVVSALGYALNVLEPNYGKIEESKI